MTSIKIRVIKSIPKKTIPYLLKIRLFSGLDNLIITQQVIRYCFQKLALIALIELCTKFNLDHCMC